MTTPTDHAPTDERVRELRAFSMSLANMLGFASELPQPTTLSINRDCGKNLNAVVAALDEVLRLRAERDGLRADAERYRVLRSRSTYRYDCGQYVLDFDNWIEVKDVDEFEGEESRPTPPDSFDAAIDALASTTAGSQPTGEG